MQSRDNRRVSSKSPARDNVHIIQNRNDGVLQSRTYQTTGGQTEAQDFNMRQRQNQSPARNSSVYQRQNVTESPTEFNYEFDMDENGALFFLGSHGRRKLYTNPHGNAMVQAFASSVGAGQIEDFVGRILTNCRTQNEPFSYFGVDLGKDRTLLPFVYTIRNRNSTTHCMMNWQFEASHDKINWVALDQRVHLTGRVDEDAYLEKEQKMLKQKGAVSSWSIDKDIYREIGFEGFRYFRILQTSKNSSGSDNLALSGFELYGQVTNGRWP